MFGIFNMGPYEDWLIAGYSLLWTLEELQVFFCTPSLKPENRKEVVKLTQLLQISLQLLAGCDAMSNTNKTTQTDPPTIKRSSGLDDDVDVSQTDAQNNAAFTESRRFVPMMSSNFSWFLIGWSIRVPACTSSSLSDVSPQQNQNHKHKHGVNTVRVLQSLSADTINIQESTSRRPNSVQTFKRIILLILFYFMFV